MSGATGAGEIFRRIVYLLEDTSYEPEPIAHNVKSGSYLTITRPISGSLYLVATGASIRPQFDTNIAYDRFAWKIDGTVFTGNMIPLTLGDHVLSLTLMKGESIVGEDSVLYTGVSNE